MHLFHCDLHGSEAADRRGVVGVLLTPSRHPERLWDTTMFAVDGPQGYEPAGMEEVRVVFAQHAPELPDGVERPGCGSALSARRIG